MNRLWCISHKLYSLGGGTRSLARIIEILEQVIYQNSISTMAEIGDGTVFFHHGLGCVVHRNAKIGAGCNIFSNVVIGNKWHNGVNEGGSPIIGDHVMIGAGAVILGEVTVGDNSIIGANAVITKDVPAGTLVVGANRILKKSEDTL